MKNILNKITLLLIVVFGFTSCYKDVIDPTEPYSNTTTPPESVSFSGQLVPLFTAKCSSAGCHGGAHAPNLTPALAYNAIQSGGYVNTGNPTASSLYQEVFTNSMPIGAPCTNAEKKLILDWIRNGAPNN